MSVTILESDIGRWRNWHETFEQPVRRLVDVWNGDSGSKFDDYKNSTRALQELIEQSLEARESLRALGGGWSWSKVAACSGTIANTKPLNLKFPVPPEHISGKYPGDPANLHLLQCGNSIAEIHRYLFRKGKSLKTCGASNGQTIAGATSNGTHGSAIDVGAIHDSVVSIHLVTSPDNHVWLERASRPAAADSLPGLLGATIIRDDDVFHAALVAFGSFGIIHGLVIEVEDLFYLTHYRRFEDLDQDLLRVIGSLDFTGYDLPRPKQRPYHFQVVLNPFNLAEGVAVDTMFKSSKPLSDTLPDGSSKFTQGDDALAIVAFLTDRLSAITGPLANGLAKIGFKEIDAVCGTLGQTFSDTSTRGRSASSALGISLAQAPSALDILRRLHEQDPVPVLFALRFVKATEALLGFTRHQERTCILEIDGVNSHRVRAFLDTAWSALAEEGITFTFHWGKLNDYLTPARVRAAYGKTSVDRWLRARGQLLPNPELRAVFTNEFLARVGLDGQ